MKHVRDMTRTYSQYFYRLTKKLSWLNWKNETIFYSLKKKTVLTREKILVRKTLLNNCYDNCFVFVINSVNQELLDTYLVTKTRQWFFVDFIRFYFMIFTLNSIHWMSQTFIIQQKHLYICYKFCFKQHFCSYRMFFMFTIVFYQKTNTVLSLIQHILRWQHQQFNLSFF